MTCQHPKGRVIGMAFHEKGGESLYYRRRECPSCGAVFTTEERVVKEPKPRQHVTSLADMKQPIDRGATPARG